MGEPFRPRHAAFEGRRPVEVPGELDVGAEVLETDAARPARLAGNGRVEDDSFGRPRPGLDRPDELVAEHERPSENCVADPSLEQPVTIRAAKPDRVHPQQHLARIRIGLGLVVETKVAGRVQPQRLHRSGRSTRRGRACAGNGGASRSSADRPATAGSSSVVRRAIAATASSAIAFSTAFAASEPHANGPCDATSTAGISSGSSPSALERLDDHVARPLPRTRPRSRRRVSARVTGTGPWKWSACVVPRQRDHRRACAHAVADGECVWTMPPTRSNAR